MNLLHYKSIKRDYYYYRFLNFASHFICFQIGFSTGRLISSVSKYSIYTFREWNARFSTRTKVWKGSSWTFVRVFNILSVNYCANIWKKYIYVLKFWGDLESCSPSGYVMIFSNGDNKVFFLDSLKKPPKKLSYDWGRLLAFPNV